MFNKIFRRGEETATSSPSPDYSYNSAENVEIATKRRHRVIASLLYDENLIMQEDCAIDEEEDEKRIKQMYLYANKDKSFKEVLEKREIAILKKVPIPMEINYEAVRQDLSTNDHIRKIIGYAVGGEDGFKNAKQQDELPLPNLISFYNKYRTPAEYQEDSKKFLDLIQEENSLQKRKEYEQDMEKFEKTFYGECWDCWKEMQQLKASAEGEEEQRKKQQRGDAVRKILYGTD